MKINTSLFDADLYVKVETTKVYSEKKGDTINAPAANSCTSTRKE